MTTTNDPRVAVVVITHQRRAELLVTLERLLALPERPRVVVGNGSRDGSADAVRQRFPQVELVASPHNLGAAGRNLPRPRPEARPEAARGEEYGSFLS